MRKAWPVILIVVGCVAVLVVIMVQIHSPYSIYSKLSSSGYRVRLNISDCGPLAPDFYTDLEVLDSHGTIVFSHFDLCDPGSREGVARILANARWDGDNLVGLDIDGKQGEIRRNPDGTWRIVIINAGN